MGSWLPWRKLASNPPGLDWPALPWQARGLYALLLGLADDSGVIRLGKLGLQSLAGALRASWPELMPHFDALVTTGWAEVQAGAVLLPHFVDSQRAATTNERVAAYRERARNAPVTPEKRDGNENLPNSNEDVTKSYPDKNRKEEIRSEENRSDSSASSEPSQPGLPLQPQQAADTPKKPSEAQVRERIALTHPTQPGSEATESQLDRAPITEKQNARRYERRAFSSAAVFSGRADATLPPPRAPVKTKIAVRFFV